MISTTHHYQCPLCGAEELTTCLTATDRMATGEKFQIVQCRHCGFLFTQDAPPPSMIGRYYGTPDYRPHGLGGGITSMLYRLVRGVMLRWKSQLIHRYHHNRGRIIDVGAGTGEFLAYMRRCGWDVGGCEQSEVAREYARKRHDLVLDGDVMQAVYTSSCADVITAWHAIEHIDNLPELCGSLYRWLKPEGLLVIAVPNANSFDSEYYGEQWAAWDVPRHLWHFSFETMNKLANAQGFRLLACHALPLDACYICLLSGENKFLALVNGVRFALKGVFVPQKASSLIYVFRKAQDEHKSV